MTMRKRNAGESAIKARIREPLLAISTRISFFFVGLGGGLGGGEAFGLVTGFPFG